MHAEIQRLTRGQAAAIGIVLILAAVVVWRLGPEPALSPEGGASGSPTAASAAGEPGWSIAPRGEAGLREGVLWEAGDGNPLFTAGPLVLRPGADSNAARCLITRWPEGGPFDLLELAATAADRGTLDLRWTERDPTGRETWQVAIPVEPGRNVLKIRLAPEPQGDLRASGPGGDGQWNPHGQPLELRIAFTGGLLDIGALRLTSR